MDLLNRADLPVERIDGFLARLDLIRERNEAAAYNDARAKADAVAGEEMARMQQGMGLPPGFKLPGMG